MITSPCECEHICHARFQPINLSPNGNPGHHYTTRFAAEYLVKKETPYGMYTVCKDCAEDCMAHVTKEQM